MEREWAAILNSYGQDVTVYTQDKPQGVRVRAFFQPVAEQGTAQAVPSPLGQVMQDRFLYLGPPEPALSCDSCCRAEVRGEVFRAQSVQPVWVGGQIAYWRAVFVRREQEVIG